MERREWTQEDLEALTQATETLERLGVWGVSVSGLIERRTKLHVSRHDMAQIARLPGVTVQTPEYKGPNWEVVACVGRVTVFALMDTADLPSVGWRLVGPVPRVERLEEVAAHDVPDSQGRTA
jgi:hypothetical protein